MIGQNNFMPYMIKVKDVIQIDQILLVNADKIILGKFPGFFSNLATLPQWLPGGTFLVIVQVVAGAFDVIDVLDRKHKHPADRIVDL